MITKHQLEFYARPWHRDESYTDFKCGTVFGLYKYEGTSIVIVALKNDFPGNGHLDDVMQWFENSCTRDKKNLKVVDILNKRFYDHLIKKRGFLKVAKYSDQVIKIIGYK